MPIDYDIDHARRLVMACARGVMSDVEVFAYQRNVWTRPDVAGYDELMDLTEVEQIAAPSPAGPRLSQLADLAAAQDQPASAGKLAIVAPSPLTFGMARMYQAHRELNERSTKRLGVFRAMDEALEFLGIASLSKQDRQ